MRHRYTQDNPRYIGRTFDGRPLFENVYGGLVRYATPKGERPSRRRRLLCIYGDGSTRQPNVGAEIIGHPVSMMPINQPRRRA